MFRDPGDDDPATLIMPAWYLFLGQDLARTAQRPQAAFPAG